MELGRDRARALFPRGGSLPLSDCRCTIEGALPTRWTANEMREVPLRITNRASSPLTSEPPGPVFASYKWLDPSTGTYVDGQRAHRTKLPRVVRPNDTVDVDVRIVAPAHAGCALLRITLVQEGVAWFDDQFRSAALDVAAEVGPATLDDTAPAFAPNTSVHSVAERADRQATRTVYVSGNCHARVLVGCMFVMNQQLSLRLLPPNVDPLTVAQPGDVVLRQRNSGVPWSMSPAREGEILFPRIFYNAFHPDCLLLTHGSTSTMHRHHSSLTLYGWHHRLTVAQTVALFNERVFAALGFFDFAGASDRVLCEEGARVDLPFQEMLPGWRRSGCFMHSINHPKLRVVADIARAVMHKAGLEVTVPNVSDYLVDPLQAGMVWPVYPELAARWGFAGSYAFMPGYDPASYLGPAIMDLEEFVAKTFAAYAKLDPQVLQSSRLEQPAYRDLETLDRVAPPAPTPARAPRDGSPYGTLPDFHFWRRAVERVPADQVDPVGTPPFTLDRHTRVAALGSCFAQHVSRTLVDDGYDVLVADCGNVYTARQLLQLFDRAFGTLVPEDDAWLRPDGRYVDPFRPLLEPAGFADADAVRAARTRHLAAMRTLFERLDVLIVTLGLTEAWHARRDGSVFPLAPGVAAGTADLERYGFHNASTAEIVADLNGFVERLLGVNPAARLVLTVSPQPPIATYEPRHVLTSATYTKAALRAAADEVERRHAQVSYFPGYEVVAGSFSRGMYYEHDLRSVTPAGVERVMELFFTHYAPQEQRSPSFDELLLVEGRRGLDVLCDEEELAPD
jgi:hypothetical protein